MLDAMMIPPFSPLAGGFGHSGAIGLGMGMGYGGYGGVGAFGGLGGLGMGYPGASLGSPMSRMAMGLNFSMSPTEAARRMIMACNHQRWHIVQALLDLYEDLLVDVRSIGPYDGTPLHASAAAGQTDVMVSLMNYGADINALAQLGYTPLFMAVSNARPNAARLLLQAGADPNAICAPGVTPLFAAVDRGAVQVVQILLDGGACPFAKNPVGDEPLHVAARQGQMEIAQALVEAGANIHEIGAQGLPAYALALTSGFPELGEMLRTGVIPPHLRLEHGGVGAMAMEGALVPYGGGFNPGALMPYSGYGMGSMMPYGGLGMGAMMPYGGYGIGSMLPYGRHGLGMHGGFSPYGAYGGDFGMSPYDTGHHTRLALDLAYPGMGMGMGHGMGWDGMYGGYSGYGRLGLRGLRGLGMYGGGLDLMSGHPHDMSMMTYPGTGLDMMYNNYGMGDSPGYGSHMYGLGYGMPNGMGRALGHNHSLMSMGYGGGLGLRRSRSMMGLSGLGFGGLGMEGYGGYGGYAGYGGYGDYGGYGGYGRYGGMHPHRGLGGMRGFDAFDRYGRHGYGRHGYGRHGYGRHGMRMSRRERRHGAEELAGMIVDQISQSIRIRTSDKKQLFKRLVRNARTSQLDVMAISEGRESTHGLASILMTDSHGKIDRDETYDAVVAFIRSLRESAVSPYSE